MTNDERIVIKIGEVLGEPPKRFKRESLAWGVWNAIKPIIEELMKPKVVAERKQEVIGDLTNALEEIRKRKYINPRTSEMIYDLIALHFVREFPEEANEMFDELSEVCKAPYVNPSYIREWLRKFKCLWEGQDKPKGTCAKCGGNKVIPLHEGRGTGVAGEGLVNCPDCGGTGKCQHKVRNWGQERGMGLCLNCDNIIQDKRSGDGRRVRKPVIMADTNFVYSEHSQHLGCTVYIVDRRTLADRRK